MSTFFIEHWIEVLFGLISAGALAFCKSLWNNNKELKKLQEEDKNRQYRQMILNEIEPIIDELTKLEKEIKALDTKVKTSLEQFKANASAQHKDMYKDLESVQAKNNRNFELILNSYKFRLIQLCKSHLRDDYITESDFEQITEMYKLYHGLGGNGQAQEYYEKVLKLDIRPDEK